MSLLVGRAGLPDKAKGSLGACKAIKELGLDGFEVEFVRGVYMKKDVADEIGEQAKSLGVALTVHAPFYINLNSKDEEVIEASKKRILDSAERGVRMGAKSITFHAGYRHEKNEEEAFALFRDEIKDVMSKAPKEIRISPECTGKFSQFGTWDELLRLHKDIGCGVCFDFSHIWARELGKVDFNDVLNKIKQDYKWWKDMHMHMSGIRFGQKGELNHQSFDDTEFPWKKVLSLLSEKGFGGLIICENPSPTTGALQIQEFLNTIH